MKFDRILMNPPYKGDLHLKIVEECIDHVTDDGRVVNMSPIRWLTTYYHRRNTPYEGIIKFIENVDPISTQKSQESFRIRINTQLGIYSLCRNCASAFDPRSLQIPLVNRVVEYMTENPAPFDKDMKDGWRVRISTINAGPAGHGENGRDDYFPSIGKLIYFLDGERDSRKWYTFYTRNQFTKSTDTITNSIKFGSEKECINFIGSYDTDFVRYITSEVIQDIHFYPDMVVYMAGKTNPRTGLVGYESEWTDDDFREYFKVSDEEWNHIRKSLERFPSIKIKNPL